MIVKTEMERLSEQSLSIAKLSSTWVGVFIRGVSIPSCLLTIAYDN